jgi:putative toxin-antitoxin system antitoxin component (TIGR02293 family)
MAKSAVSEPRRRFDQQGSYQSVLEATPEQLIARIREGLAYRELEELRQHLDVSVREMARLANIPGRTLTRRRQAGRLDTVESEHVLRLERVLALAVDMLRDAGRARQWLKTPKSALDGKTPLEYADTEVGAREVENLIGRIRHGVFS